MEATTPFDLSHAVRQWREDLAQSPALQSENLDELEAHLRDSVARLEAGGLSEEEAFLIATRRIGKRPFLEQEFGKVNRSFIWFDRILWALIAFQIWSPISNVIYVFLLRLFGWLEKSPPYYTTPRPFPLNMTWSNFLGTPLSVAIAGLLVYALFSKTGSRFQTFFRNLLTRPIALAVVLFVAGYSYNVVWLISGVSNPAAVIYPAMLSSVVRCLTYVALTFFVARQRLRLSKA
jgi:hypothetical protein